MSLQLRQDVATVRLSPEADAELFDIAVLVEMPWPARPARMLSGALEFGELEDLAAAELAAMSERLPPALRRSLVTEAGALEQTVRRDDELLASRTVRYVMSTCRGAVLARDIPSEEWPHRWGCAPWTGTIEPGDLPGDVATVLAPAALLALVLHVDGAAADYDWTAGQHESTTGPLLVRDTASPYPPHTSPVDLVATQPLGVDELPPDPFLLRALFRPEWWSRPAGSLAEDEVRSVLISCEMTPEAPERALVMEELVPVTSGTGSGRWLATATLCAGGRRLASRTDLLVQLDPVRTLRSCRGALSGVQIAVVSNPLAGDRYGFAPWVLVTERLRELVA